MAKVAIKTSADDSAKPKAKKVSAARSKATIAKPATRAAYNATVKSASTAVKPEAVVKYGAEAVRGLLSNGATEAKKAKEQLLNMSKESAAQLAKGADAATRSMNEILALGKENMDTCVECGNIAVDASKSISAELISYANKSFSQNVELSKELFGCRTLNDMFDLQSKMLKANLDGFFSQSVKVSEMAFRCASEVSEPLNERVTETTERLTKSWSDAA